MKYRILTLLLSSSTGFNYHELCWKGELIRKDIKQHLIDSGYIYNNGSFVILNVIEMTEEEFNNYIG